MSQTGNSIKKNFAYKSILTVSGYLVAFIVFPYVSRVLGVANIGVVNFVDNTIQYFLLFASMGIGVLGVREIAKVRDNKQQMSKVFSNLLGVNLLFTALTIVIYIMIVIFSSKLTQYSELFYVGVAKILFTAFLVEWFYTGMEEFKYITIRSILVKLLYVIAVFVFVKDQQDYKIYFYLTVAMTVVNSLINLIYARKFIKIDVRELFKFKYISQNITLGIYSVMTSMYLTFNVVYLGFTTNDVQVGLYVTAYKLYSVVVGLFSAFTSVMLPRMSALVSNEQTSHFRQLVVKSFSAMSMFSIPLVLYSLVMAPHLVYVLAGPGYEGAVLPMKIIMPAVLPVDIAQILALQILMPLNKEKVLLIASTIGAFLGISINILTVKDLMSIGSSITLICSEVIVTLVYVIYIYRHKIVALPWKELWINFLISLPVPAVAWLCLRIITNAFVCVLVSAVVAMLIWILFIYLFRRDVLCDVIGKRS